MSTTEIVATIRARFPETLRPLGLSATPGEGADAPVTRFSVVTGWHKGAPQVDLFDLPAPISRRQADKVTREVRASYLADLAARLG